MYRVNRNSNIKSLKQSSESKELSDLEKDSNDDENHKLN